MTDESTSGDPTPHAAPSPPDVDPAITPEITSVMQAFAEMMGNPDSPAGDQSIQAQIARQQQEQLAIGTTSVEVVADGRVFHCRATTYIPKGRTIFLDFPHAQTRIPTQGDADSISPGIPVQLAAVIELMCQLYQVAGGSTSVAAGDGGTEQRYTATGWDGARALCRRLGLVHGKGLPAEWGDHLEAVARRFDMLVEDTHTMCSVILCCSVVVGGWFSRHPIYLVIPSLPLAGSISCAASAALAVEEEEEEEAGGDECIPRPSDAFGKADQLEAVRIMHTLGLCGASEERPMSLAPGQLAHAWQVSLTAFPPITPAVLAEALSHAANCFLVSAGNTVVGVAARDIHPGDRIRLFRDEYADLRPTVPPLTAVTGLSGQDTPCSCGHCTVASLPQVGLWMDMHGGVTGTALVDLHDLVTSLTGMVEHGLLGNDYTGIVDQVANVMFDLFGSIDRWRQKLEQDMPTLGDGAHAPGNAAVLCTEDADETGPLVQRLSGLRFASIGTLVRRIVRYTVQAMSTACVQGIVDGHTYPASLDVCDQKDAGVRQESILSKSPMDLAAIMRILFLDNVSLHHAYRSVRSDYAVVTARALMLDHMLTRGKKWEQAVIHAFAPEMDGSYPSPTDEAVGFGSLFGGAMSSFLDAFTWLHPECMVANGQETAPVLQSLLWRLLSKVCNGDQDPEQVLQSRYQAAYCHAVDLARNAPVVIPSPSQVNGQEVVPYMDSELSPTPCSTTLVLCRPDWRVVGQHDACDEEQKDAVLTVEEDMQRARKRRCGPGPDRAGSQSTVVEPRVFAIVTGSPFTAPEEVHGKVPTWTTHGVFVSLFRPASFSSSPILPGTVTVVTVWMPLKDRDHTDERTCWGRWGVPVGAGGVDVAILSVLDNVPRSSDTCRSLRAVVAEAIELHGMTGTWLGGWLHGSRGTRSLPGPPSVLQGIQQWLPHLVPLTWPLQTPSAATALVQACLPVSDSDHVLPVALCGEFPGIYLPSADALHPVTPGGHGPPRDLSSVTEWYPITLHPTGPSHGEGDVPSHMQQGLAFVIALVGHSLSPSMYPSILLTAGPMPVVVGGPMISSTVETMVGCAWSATCTGNMYVFPRMLPPGLLEQVGEQYPPPFPGDVTEMSSEQFIDLLGPDHVSVFKVILGANTADLLCLQNESEYGTTMEYGDGFMVAVVADVNGVWRLRDSATQQLVRKACRPPTDPPRQCVATSVASPSSIGSAVETGDPSPARPDGWVPVVTVDQEPIATLSPPIGAERHGIPSSRDMPGSAAVSATGLYEQIQVHLASSDQTTATTIPISW
jgi:hypothetical protein